MRLRILTLITLFIAVGAAWGSEGRYLLVLGIDSANVGRYDFETGKVTRFINVGADHKFVSILAAGPDGHVYVGLANKREIRRYDGKTGEFLDVFVSNTPAFPHGLAFDRTGLLYIASHEEHTITRYDRDGNYLDTFVRGDYGLRSPREMTFDAKGNLYVSSALNHQIWKLDAKGKGAIFSRGFESDMEGHAFDAAGNLFVAYVYDNTLRKFDPKGTFLGAFEVGMLGVNRPRDVLIRQYDKSERFYVCSEYQNKVYEFDALGRPLKQIDFGSVGIHRLGYMVAYTPAK